MADQRQGAKRASTSATPAARHQQTRRQQRERTRQREASPRGAPQRRTPERANEPKPNAQARQARQAHAGPQPPRPVQQERQVVEAPPRKRQTLAAPPEPARDIGAVTAPRPKVVTAPRQAKIAPPPFAPEAAETAHAVPTTAARTPPAKVPSAEPSIAGSEPVEIAPFGSATGRSQFPTLALMAAIAPHAEGETAIAEQPTDSWLPEPAPFDAHIDRQPTQPPAPSAAVPAVRAPQRPAEAPSAQAGESGRSLDAAPPWRPSQPRRRKSAGRPEPLPEVKLVLPVAGVQVAVAAAAALTGATMLVLGNPGGWWPIALAGIACIGGWLAYVFAHYVRWEHVSGFMLAFSQVVVLGWCMALVGPHASLLVLAPAIALLALRTSLRFVAVYSALASVGLYIAFASLTLSGQLQPALQLDPTAGAVFDGVVVILGLALLLWGALDLHAGRERAAAIARSRRYELRLIKGQTAQLRRQQEDDVERLHAAMAYALQGRRIGPDIGEGTMSALAPDVGALADRVASLQDDREERRRVETAVHRLLRALERLWLGLPSEWPEPSGTKVDDIVALLRAPTPRDSQPSQPGDTPALIPVPAADSTPGRLDAVQSRSFPLVRLKSVSGPLGVARGNGTTKHAPLPWDEWDTWRGWDPSMDY